MLKFEELNPETVQRYRYEIAQFYYGNMKTLSAVGHPSFEQAYEKTGDLIAHLKTNTCIAYGAFAEREIVGYIWAYPYTFREERRMYINECSVKEEYRSRGIGKTLLQLVEKRAKEAGFPALYLHAEAGSPDAVRFYESNGYSRERIQFRKAILQYPDD